ncbi:MAG: hypothetical protein ACXABY_14420 [Candidatus Thorarchaeota archaeon]
MSHTYTYGPFSGGRRRKRRSTPVKKVHELTPFTKQEIDKLDPELRKDNRYLKKWINLSTTSTNNRLWKSGVFLHPNVFATRIKQKAGACLYHICLETKRHICFAKIPKETTDQCPECEGEISKGIYTLTMLQKLK